MEPQSDLQWIPWLGRYMRFTPTYTAPPAMRVHSARAARLTHQENTPSGSQEALRKRRKVKRKISKRSRRRNR